MALLAGASLLGATAFAARATTEWTLGVDLATGVDYLDPVLAYDLPTWQIEYATCLKLVNHPDAGGQRSAELVPEASPFPRISSDGRVYTFDVRPTFTRFRRHAGRAESLRPGARANGGQADVCAGSAVHAGHRRRRPHEGGEGAAPLRCARPREPASDPAPGAGFRLPRAARPPVLLRDPTADAAAPGRDLGAATECRPVFHPPLGQETGNGARAEPALPGAAPSQPGARRLHDRLQRRAAIPARQPGADGLDSPGRSSRA